MSFFCCDSWDACNSCCFFFSPFFCFCFFFSFLLFLIDDDDDDNDNDYDDDVGCWFFVVEL